MNPLFWVLAATTVLFVAGVAISARDPEMRIWLWRRWYVAATIAAGLVLGMVAQAIR